MKIKNVFEGRSLLIATKHKKEIAIAPIFEKSLGVKCAVSLDFDTDTLGTFSGEVERIDDPITTARKKCQLALQATNFDLAVASEGSFGPHPELFFVHANSELLLFVDKKNDLEITATELSTETNFNGADITAESQLMEFAEMAQFPTHGLILRKKKDDFTDIIKGITDQKKLIESFRYLVSVYGCVFVETDMRAMYNPSRMKVIESVTKKLVDKINSRCPQCQTPGFGVTQVKPGLPCELCNTPTRSTLYHVYTCQKCGHQMDLIYPNGKQIENAMYCDICNP